MAITALPTPPSRQDPDNFAARGDAFLGALPDFATEANQLALDVNNDEIAAAASAAAAALSESNAAASESAADASAQTALLAPGTSATSTTSLTIGVGAKSLTIQTGKLFVVGMTIKIASTASPLNWMAGTLTSYDSGTGALVVNVDTTNGSGTLSDWTVSLSAPTSTAPVWVKKSSAYTAVHGDKISADMSGGQFTITAPASPSTGDWFTIRQDNTSGFEDTHLLVSGNGNDIMQDSADFEIDINLLEVTFVFNGTEWRI